jgi:hypothetical protein
MDWHDMRQYYKGKDPEGQDRFAIPLSADDDGMVGRECPQEECQPRYFKTDPREESSPTPTASEEATGAESENRFYCPYCGHQAGFQDFTTHDQLEWVKSMIIRDAHRTIQGMFSRSFGSNRYSSGGLVHLTYRPGSLPSVRHYAEKRLKRIVECDRCGSKYAVYGISIFCPRCRQGNLHLHLRRSIETINVLLEMKSDIEAQAGSEAGYHLLGNCLEDCISLFEGFLKVIYSQALRFLMVDEMRQQKLSELRNSFQNPSRAENIIRSDLGWELFSDTTQSEREYIELQFAKRHVITHNLGLVDERFPRQAQTWQTAGQDVEIHSQDIARLLSMLEAILQRVIAKLESMNNIV